LLWLVVFRRSIDFRDFRPLVGCRMANGGECVTDQDCSLLGQEGEERGQAWVPQSPPRACSWCLRHVLRVYRPPNDNSVGTKPSAHDLLEDTQDPNHGPVCRGCGTHSPFSWFRSKSLEFLLRNLGLRSQRFPAWWRKSVPSSWEFRSLFHSQWFTSSHLHLPRVSCFSDI
jgi:hypothetical protein